MVTVIGPVASTEATILGEKARAGTSAASSLVSAFATVSAFRAVPSWKVTPSRMVKSHVRSPVWVQAVARPGSTVMLLEMRVSPS